MIKKNKIKIILVIFFTVVLGDVLAVINQNIELEIIFKPFLMILLIVFYYFSVKVVNKWLVTGLIFSFLGDVFLLNQKDYFVFGIACFIVTHVFYIKMLLDFLKVKSFTRVMLSVLPFLIYLFFILNIIYDNLNEMFFPVLEYGIIISVYGSVAIMLFLQKKIKSNFLIMLSGITFALSDSFILLNLYANHTKTLDFLVITLYIASQCLVVKGMILREYEKKVVV